MYKDLYDHNSNSNGTVTKSNVNARNVTDDVSHYVARIQVRAPTTTLNFRDQEEATLISIKNFLLNIVIINFYFKNLFYKTIFNHPLNLLIQDNVQLVIKILPNDLWTSSQKKLTID